MNLREGTGRLALLLGAVGTILGDFASGTEVQSVISQRTAHKMFEQLGNSDVVKQERKSLQSGPQIDPATGERANSIKEYSPQELWKLNSDHSNPPDTLPALSGWDSMVQKGGIDTIVWGKGYVVACIEEENGQTLYPTPAPTWRTYFLNAIFPILGFFIPCGAIRAIGWVGAGFFQTPK